MRLKTLIPCLLGGSMAFSAGASTCITDSLKHELQQAVSRSAGTEELAALYQELGTSYENTDIDSMLFYLDKGLSLFPRPDYKSMEYLQLLNSKATAHFYRSELILAKELFRQVIEHAASVKNRDYVLESDAQSSAGICCRRLGLRDSALYYYQEAIASSRKINDAATVGSLYFNIGVMYLSESRYEDALANARTAVEYGLQTDDALLKASVYSLQGAACMKLGDYTQAAEVLKKGVKEGQEAHSPAIIMKCLPTLINTYLSCRQFDSIPPYLELGRQCVKALPEGSPMVLGFREAEASTYCQTGKYQLSIDCLTADSLQATHTPYDQYHYILARNYEGLHDFKRAYEHLGKTYHYRDSLFNTKTRQEMSELQAQLRLNEKELVISRLQTQQAEQGRERLMFITGILVLLAVIILLQYQRRIQKKQTELLAARKYIDGMESERKRLAKELHDGVCNDLLAAYFKVHNTPVSDVGKEEAEQLIDKIRDNVRSISHALMPPNFAFATIDEILAAYFQSLAATVPLDIRYESDNELPWEKIPEHISFEVYRIVQEVMGNILRHSDAHWIHAQMWWNHDGLRLSFRNDCSEHSATDGCMGIGTQTLSDRLKAVNGTSERKFDGHEYTLQIFIGSPLGR